MATTETQRRRESRKKSDSRIIRIQTSDRLGNPRWVTADLVDVSDDGVGISLRTPLAAGSKIVVRGDLGEKRGNLVSPAIVMWCTENINGNYHAGLQLGENNSGAKSSSAVSPETAEGLDWYEVMQLSPHADADTITRVYRILATRYHPDSATGNQTAFLRLCEAYRVLSDPVQRAQYDVRFWETKKLRWKIFDRTDLAASPDGERRKRRGILEALYAKALVDPEASTMGVFEFEELLGCPREHLEAAFWYLKGKGFVKRGDNNRYSITVSGFDEIEGNSRPREDAARQLLEAGPIV